MTKTILRLTLSGIFAVLTAILLMLANLMPSVFFSFYSDFSRWILGVIAAVTGVVPFAVCEIFGFLLIALIILFLVRAIIKHRIVRYLAGLLLTVCALAFAFVALWGLNYYAPSMNEQVGLEEREYTVSELKAAAVYYRDMANATANDVERDEGGAMVDCDFDLLAEAAGEGFEKLSDRYDCFDGSTVRVKSLIISPIMGKIGMTGGFICLTGESCVSSTTYSAALPFTMCHEISHRMAFAREDEANFGGFLGCIFSERSEFVYSGYYMAFRYCYNALAKVDAAAAAEVWAGVRDELAADCHASAVHYEAVRDETASSIADTVYDSYLNSFSVESGVQSYGEVVDLLIAWYAATSDAA